MNTEKIPFVVEITEEHHKTVLVYADSEMKAEEITEALRFNDAIDMTVDGGSYMLSCEITVTGIAEKETLHCYERYCENGRVLTDVESTNYKAMEQAKEYIRNFLVSKYGETDGDPFFDLTNISLAYTSYEEGSEECNHPYTVDVKADLINFKIRTYINDILVSTMNFECLRDMTDNFLDSMDHDDMIYLLDSEWREYYYVLLQMDNIGGKFPPNREGINSVKFMFHPGCRIQLICMREDPDPVPNYMQGSVDYVDDAGHIHMKWDNGRTLPLIPGVDQFVKLNTAIKVK